MGICSRMRALFDTWRARSREPALESSPPAAAAVEPASTPAGGRAAAAPFYSAPLHPQNPGDVLPVATSGYGRRHASDPANWAIDASMPIGWRYRAIGRGTVVRVSDADADQWNGCGVWVLLEDGPIAGHVIAGIHLSSRVVNVGDIVQPGQILGLTGNTGASTGPHLHLEISNGGVNEIDPMDPGLIDWKGAGWSWGGWDK
jgi:murein DD-endopeptidase MepM/ murein hydrolase activator NlpD